MRILMIVAAVGVLASGAASAGYAPWVESKPSARGSDGDMVQLAARVKRGKAVRARIVPRGKSYYSGNRYCYTRGSATICN